MCDSRSAPEVFISLRLLLLRYESHIQNPTFPFLFVFFHSDKKDTSCFIQKRKTHPVSFRNERHILFHSETKDTSCFIQKRRTRPVPQLYPSYLSLYIILGGKVSFFQCFIPFWEFHWCSNMCCKPRLYPSYSSSFTLKRKTLLPLLFLLLLAFRDERNISMLTQSILPSTFIFIQK